MNTTEFKVRVDFIRKHVGIGEKIISHFKDYIADELSDELTLQNETSVSRLSFNFYGLTIVCRIELRLREGSAEGWVSAYRLTYDREPVEESLLRYRFDELGNVRRDDDNKFPCFTHNDCAKPFFADMFTFLATKDDILLRP